MMPPDDNLACVRPKNLAAIADAQLGHRITFDLTDPLAGDSEDPPDLVQRARTSVVKTVAQPDDSLLAIVQASAVPG